MHAVFISYASPDKAVAYGACKVLEAGGVSCWIAPRDVMAGRPYSGQITEAIRRARVFVLILSRNSDQSRQVLREVERAAHSKIHLVTFRIENFEASDDLGYFLSVEHWLNAYEEGQPEEHFQELLQNTASLIRENPHQEQGAPTKGQAEAKPVGTQRFANYDILKHPDGSLFRLGHGAMGVTYKAFDTSLDRHVALKVIAADLLGNDEARRRFLREARAAARIQHPHVAAIHHLGQEGEDYFYTMELVEGEDMERYVQTHGPLAPSAALRVVLQVAEALEAAQVHQLIHRDIKPANIMARVNRAGKLDVKLIDFGLAKGAGPGSLELSRVSHTMSFVGSPAYASPEQCEMGDLDTRSDIYSLGTTLWFLLTGKPPFVGNVNQVLIAHVVKTPPFEQLQGVPDLVVGLLRQMLAKSPDGRPKDPQALQEAIQAIEPQLAGQSGKISETSEILSMQTAGLGTELAESPGRQDGSSGPGTVVSSSLELYLRVEPAILVAERYRLIEALPEGNGGKLFLAHDEKPDNANQTQVALKLVHPEIASNYRDLLKDEIELIEGASHPHLLTYSGVESTPEGLFIVREWVHGLLLYDLLRVRRSFKPEEVVAILEPLPATLDFISGRGLGLVEVSIRKLFLSCPPEMRLNEFPNLASGNARGWSKCKLKLNPLSLALLLLREGRDWSSQTLVPASRVLSMTQAEAGIRGTKAVGILGRLIYELISGRAPAAQINQRPSPLPLLNEAGNWALWKAWAPAGETATYGNCEEFWGVFKENISERGPIVTVPTLPPLPPKAEAEKRSALSGEIEIKKQSEPVRQVKLEGEHLGAEDQDREPSRVPPPLPPAYKLYDSRAIGLAAFIGSPLAGAILMALNYQRLGNIAAGIATASVGTLMTGLIILIGSTVPGVGGGVMPIILLIVMMYGAKALQGTPVKEHIRLGGRLGSRWIAAGAGLATMVSLLVIVFSFLYGSNLGVSHPGSSSSSPSVVPRRETGRASSDEGLSTSSPSPAITSPLLQKAVGGDGEAMTKLGTVYMNGDGVAQDYVQARTWYQKGAAAGNTDAMNSLGELYYYGRGVAQDYAQAREWYQKAAQGNNANALYSLGWMYEKGQGAAVDYVKAREWYQKAAEAGNVDAMNNLGAFYQNGQGVTQDYGKAREWFLKAAGNKDAMNNLGELYYYGRGVTQDYVQARGWYEKGAAAGSPGAMYNMGWLYEKGFGVSVDYAQARDWYQKAAAAGNSTGMNSLGTLYESGLGVAQDYDKAREWYQKAAEAGNVIAMKNLALLYQNGNGVTQDYVKAREWYQKAAEEGNVVAMHGLAWLYENGKGVTQDYVQAREWYQKAADGGDAVAMHGLGWLYENGKGVARDYVQAQTWYQKAADAGILNSMVGLGNVYLNGGWGVVQDYAKAREWFQKASDAGSAIAMTNLGWLYQNGWGVVQDYGKARDWYQKAANGGDTGGMTNLGWLYEKGLGVTRDYTKARGWYQKAAAAGDSNAQQAVIRLGPK